MQTMMTMMMLLSILLIVAVSATPAIVWKNSSSSPVVHRSSDIKSEVFFAEALSNGEQSDSAVNAVVFLLGRGQGGTESLSAWASQGLLSNISVKQSDASSVHHHVSGIKSVASVASACAKFGYNTRIVELDEYITILSQMTGDSEVELSGNQILKSNVLIVDVDASIDPKKLDSAVANSIDNKAVTSVVLSGVRSLEEVGQERMTQEYRRLEIMEKAGRGMKTSVGHRRLEEAEVDDAANQAQNESVDLSGIYYVSLTPNILAGILFFVLFTMITYIGVGCMGMIAGQDVFVSKMPAIGREA